MFNYQVHGSLHYLNINLFDWLITESISLINGPFLTKLYNFKIVSRIALLSYFKLGVWLM